MTGAGVGNGYGRSARDLQGIAILARRVEVPVVRILRKQVIHPHGFVCERLKLSRPARARHRSRGCLRRAQGTPQNRLRAAGQPARRCPRF